jgi:hypothetical protein
VPCSLGTPQVYGQIVGTVGSRLLLPAWL